LEKILTLSELLVNYFQPTSIEFMSMCKSLDGNLKDIGNGTHIKIPMDAGYVNFYRSVNSYEITVWMKLEIQDNLAIKAQHQVNS